MYETRKIVFTKELLLKKKTVEILGLLGEFNKQGTLAPREGEENWNLLDKFEHMDNRAITRETKKSCKWEIITQCNKRQEVMES